MGSNRGRQTTYPALQPDSGYGYSGTFFTGPQAMSRSDSGYMSNLSNRQNYYGDPSSVLQEEAEDYQFDDSSMTRTYQYSLHTHTVDDNYDQQQFSDYMLEGAGSHMAGYYPDEPRTSMRFEPSQDMELDDDNGLYPNGEDLSQWTTQLDMPQYAHESYHDQAGPNTLSPAHDDDTSATYFPMSTPSAVLPSSSTTTSRRRLPSTSNRHQSVIPSTPIDVQTPLAKSPSQLTSPTSSTPTNKFPCLMPSCTKQFNRAADLDRHMKFIHCKATVRAMLCDYRRCPRHKNPFHRADHFRDHLRDQHREDLLKRGESTSPDLKWWLERSPSAVFGGWWRCSKCFVRVAVDKDGWQCGSCGNYCETERQGRRRLPRGCEYTGCCEGTEFSSPARFREHLRGVHGEDVPVKEGKEGEKELADQGWWKGRSGEAVCSPVWRCTRCLDAVDSREDGFACARCGFECEEVRRGYHASSH